MGYRDYKPDRKDGEKIETLDEVINKINALIREGKFEGRIVSVECLQCESTGDHRFDPEVLAFSNSMIIKMLAITEMLAIKNLKLYYTIFVLLVKD